MALSIPHLGAPAPLLDARRFELDAYHASARRIPRADVYAPSGSAAPLMHGLPATSRVTSVSVCSVDRRVDATTAIGPLCLESIVRATEHANVLWLWTAALADGIDVIKLEERS